MRKALVLAILVGAMASALAQNAPLPRVAGETLTTILPEGRFTTRLENPPRSTRLYTEGEAAAAEAGSEGSEIIAPFPTATPDPVTKPPLRPPEGEPQPGPQGVGTSITDPQTPNRPTVGGP